MLVLTIWRNKVSGRMNKFDRIYDLHRIFRQRRYPVAMQTLCDELECGEATVKRLIRLMREQFGAPIFNVRGKGWRYDPNIAFELPGMWFNADELAALLGIQRILSGLQPGLLDQAMGPIRRRVDALLQRAAPGAGREMERVKPLAMMPRARRLPRFSAVAGAVVARRRLVIDYHARRDDRVTTREVSPQRLVHYRDNWYLDAFCHLRGELRSFAVERILRVRKLKQAAKELPRSQLDAFYSGAYGIFGGEADKRALLRFTPERARWVADEIWHPEQQGCWLEDGRYQLAIPYGNPTELILDICRHGAEVEVIDPPELRAAVADRLRRAAEQYD